MDLDPKHPKSEFSCLVRGNADGALEGRLRNIAMQLAAARRWVIGPPEFATFGSEGASELTTYGMIWDVYSAFPPWGERLPAQVDEAHYEEAQLVVGALKALSAELNDEIELYLDQTYIGSIESGEPDHLLQQGLLEPWRQHLDSRRRQERTN